MSRILPLPAEAISQIHSSKNITSLQDVILALLENSLDASATRIEVTVDFRRGCCTVEDDGEGIPVAEFGEGGGLGKMYHSSKRDPHFDRKHDLHGSTGTYLASLAALSLLSVTSRRLGDPGQATISMHKSKVISRNVSASSSELVAHAVHGTRVIVRDLFGNMPVRVKQRALAVDDGSAEEKAWHQLKHGVAALLLPWPKPCSVRLIDSNRSDRKVYMAGSHPSTHATLTRTGLRQLHTGRQSTFGLKEVLPVLFQAGLAPPESRSEWVPVSASADDVTVKGLISLDPAPTKQCQFVSLGIYPCVSSGFSEMYDAINKVFTNSSFGAAEELSDVDEQEKLRRTRDGRFKADGYTQKQLHGRKGVDRWPMYILQVKLRSQRIGNSEVSKLSDAALKSIVGVLEATVTQWLAAHHFQPRKRRRRREKETQERPTSAVTGQTMSTGSVHTGGLIGSQATPDNSKCHQNAEPGTASKRRKIVDLSGRPQSMDRSLLTPTDGAESPFRLWSRIKSGKQSRQSHEHVLRKAATAPEGQTGCLTEPAPNSRASCFTLPSVEAGSLNAARQLHASMHRTAGTPCETASNSNTLAGSGDDFGSVDDDALVAVAVETEARLGDLDPGLERNEAAPDELVDWIDPKSKQHYRVNTRTGVVLPARSKMTHPPLETESNKSKMGRQSAAINTTVSSIGRPLSMARRATPSRPMTRGDDETDAQWLPGFLQEWNNPVFVHQDEERIPVALPEGPGPEIEDASNHRCHHHLLQEAFENVNSKGVGRLTKGYLRSAKVIRQVDRKFILCKTQDGEGVDGQNLVLVDQHAASERVILEGLLAQLCEPAEGPSASPVKTSMLEKPLRFQVSPKEHELFYDRASHFSDWGILYRMSQREEAVSASQDVRVERKKEHILTVTHLPSAIAERCTLIPRILVEMLRSEVWTAAETNRRPAVRATSTTGDDEAKDQHAWLKRIGPCPKGVLEMLNSRACRSAIMFNDELSLEQCEELMKRLSACAFPFMCAHGRVSMVPLVGLGGDGNGVAGVGDTMVMAGSDGGGGFGKQQESGRRFSAAFGQWIGRNESRDS